MATVDLILEMIDIIWLVVKYGWWLGILFMLFIMKMRYKNYPIEAIIIEKRGNNHIKTNDRVGKYTDKYTGIIGWRFMKTKETVPVVDFDWIMHNNRKDLGLLDKLLNRLYGNAGTAFFYKYGSRQYKPIEVTSDKETKIEWEEIKDKKGEPILVSIIKPIDPRERMAGLDFKVVDWDNMNFMTQEQRASIERRKKKSEVWKQILIPAMMMGITLVFVIIMIKFGYDYAMDIKGGVGQNPPVEPTNPNIPIVGDLLPT